MHPSLRRGSVLSLRVLLVALAIAAPPLVFTFADVTSTNRLAAWACSILGMLGLFIAAGLAIRGRVLGVLVDERNRYSLSRLQITLWTVLVLGTIYVVFVSNLFLGGGWGDALSVDLDWNLVLLMGFSVASFALAPTALSLKTVQPADAATLASSGQQLLVTQNLQQLPDANGRVLVKQTPQDARLADLIRGEDVANATTVDLPRTQMLIMTMAIVLVYGGALAACLSSGGSTRIGELPTLSNTLLGLILVSHGGYLVGKLLPNTNTSGVNTDHAVRALQASQKAATLAADLRMQLQGALPGEARYPVLQASAALAQTAAADAAALATRVGAGAAQSGELAALEGRISALEAGLRAQLGKATPASVAEAVPADLVSAVQRRLAALGHALSVSGVPDVPTEQAIAKEMAKAGLERAQLHPRAYRYYEEVAQLI